MCFLVKVKTTLDPRRSLNKSIMRIVITLLFVAMATFSIGQDTYKASNGITYHIGDTILLGRGSAQNGDFLYLQMGGWAAIAGHDQSKGSDQNNISKAYSGTAVTLKKIKTYKIKGVAKVYFTVGGGNITNYSLIIEDAIESCEVKDCNKKEGAKADDKYAKLAKIKELLDSGVLTQEEFDKEKAKILSE